MSCVTKNQLLAVACALMLSAAACSGGSDSSDDATESIAGTNESNNSSEASDGETIASEAETSAGETSDPGDTSDTQAEDAAGGSVHGDNSGEGNASITLGEAVYRFETIACDTDTFAETNVAGVITLDGSPAFVEFTIFNEESGVISIDIGLTEDTGIEETLEETVARGLSKIWNLWYDTGDVQELTDTTIRGSGTFQVVLSTDGSAGDELPGAFEADCS